MGVSRYDYVSMWTRYENTYVLTQARHCLNSQTDWAKIDSNFNAEKFFWAIVDILESGEEGKALLEKVNKYVNLLLK